MKKRISIIAIGFLLFFGFKAYAAPTVQNFTNIQPFTDATYNNGSSTLNWLTTYTKNLQLSTTTAGCAQIAGNGIVYSTGISCGTGSGNNDHWATSTLISSGIITNGATNVGINTAPTFATLEIKASSTAATGRALQIWDSANTGLLTVQNNGQIGVGTTTPTALFAVQGKIQITSTSTPYGQYELEVGVDTQNVSTNALYLTGKVAGQGGRLYMGTPTFPMYALNMSNAAGGIEGLVSLTTRTVGASQLLCFDSNSYVTACAVGRDSVYNTDPFAFKNDVDTSKPTVFENGSTIDSGTATGFVLKTKNTLSSVGSVLLNVDNGPRTRFTILGNGNTGIGTSSPLGELTVATPNNSPGTTTNLFLIASSTASATTTLFAIQNNGAVGIGTANPSQLLTISSSGILGWDNGSGVADVLLQRDASNILALKNSTTAQELRIYGTTSSNKYLGFKHDGSNAVVYTPSGGGSIFFATGGIGTTNAMRYASGVSGGLEVASNNYFGFSGTTDPNASTDTFLTRAGAATLQLGVADAAAPIAQTLGVQNVIAGTSNTAGTNFTINGSQGTGTGTGGSILFQTAPAGTTGTAQNALATRLTILGSGNVGIGSTTPWKLLSVGTGTTGSLAIATSTAGCAQFSPFGELYSTGTACGSGGGGTASDHWATSTTDSTAIYPAGALRVGIGTSSPSAKLQVEETTNGVPVEVLNNQGSGTYTTLQFKNGYTGIANTSHIVGNLNFGPDAVSGGRFVLENTDTSGNVFEGLRLDSSANIYVDQNGSGQGLLIMPSSLPTAIGIKDPSSGSFNPWLAYVQSGGQWFSQTRAGDNAYRNVSGRLLFGNSTQRVGMMLSGDRLGVGVDGTTDPSAMFQIQATTTNIDLMEVSSTTGASMFRINSIGNIGIATATPTALFSVEAASSTVGTAQATPFGRLLAGTIAGVKYMFESFDYYGHRYTQGPAPTVTGGTSTVAGNDNNGTITVTGTLLTSVTLNFARPWLSAPDCTMADSSTGITGAISSISSTQVVIGFSAGINSGTVWYMCTGHR